MPPSRRPPPPGLPLLRPSCPPSLPPFFPCSRGGSNYALGIKRGAESRLGHFSLRWRVRQLQPCGLESSCSCCPSPTPRSLEVGLTLRPEPPAALHPPSQVSGLIDERAPFTPASSRASPQEPGSPWTLGAALPSTQPMLRGACHIDTPRFGWSLECPGSAVLGGWRAPCSVPHALPVGGVGGWTHAAGRVFPLGLQAPAVCIPVDPAQWHTCPAGRGSELESSQSDLCGFSRFLVSWEVREPSEEGQGELVMGLWLESC